MDGDSGAEGEHVLGDTCMTRVPAGRADFGCPIWKEGLIDAVGIAGSWHQALLSPGPARGGGAQP